MCAAPSSGMSCPGLLPTVFLSCIWCSSQGMQLIQHTLGLLLLTITGAVLAGQAATAKGSTTSSHDQLPTPQEQSVTSMATHAFFAAHTQPTPLRVIPSSLLLSCSNGRIDRAELRKMLESVEGGRAYPLLLEEVGTSEGSA